MKSGERADIEALLVSEAEAVEADLAYARYKNLGGPLKYNDERAFRLQQQQPEENQS